MKTPLNTGTGKSSTPIPPVPRTPTPDTAHPTETAAQVTRGDGDGKLPDHERRKRISEAAYYKSERRGFAPGEEEKDWLEAERELDRGKAPCKLRPEDNTFPRSK